MGTASREQGRTRSILTASALIYQKARPRPAQSRYTIPRLAAACTLSPATLAESVSLLQPLDGLMILEASGSLASCTEMEIWRCDKCRRPYWECICMKIATCKQCGRPIHLVKTGVTTYKWVTNPAKPNKTWTCSTSIDFPLRAHAPRERETDHDNTSS
jgi:hypothetical protein